MPFLVVGVAKRSVSIAEREANNNPRKELERRTDQSGNNGIGVVSRQEDRHKKESHQQDESVLLYRRQHPVPERRHNSEQKLAAIEWWDRDHVERGKQEIDVHEGPGKHSETGIFTEIAEGHSGEAYWDCDDSCLDEVRNRSGHRDDRHAVSVVAKSLVRESGRVDRYRFAP